MDAHMRPLVVSQLQKRCTLWCQFCGTTLQISANQMTGLYDLTWSEPELWSANLRTKYDEIVRKYSEAADDAAGLRALLGALRNTITFLLKEERIT